jgi:hypothetical protein
MRSRGKWMIAAISIVALSATAANVVYQQSLVRRTKAFWGREPAVQIARAAQVSLLKLGGSAENQRDSQQTGLETLAFDGRRWNVLERKQVADARGFVNIRRALISDSSFAWDEPVDACQPDWAYALEFEDAASRATVLLSFDCPRAALAGGKSHVSIRPVAGVLESFCEEQFKR